MARRELIFSVDIEADGPIPGPFSMLSLGAVVAGVDTGPRYYPWDLTETFYIEIQPISEDFVPEALAVSGLDRDVLMDQGYEPWRAMKNFAQWVNDVAKNEDATPVFAAWPSSFDWVFVYWYFANFGIQSPFGFSRVLDMKTAAATLLNTNLSSIGKRRFLNETGVKVRTPHTHNALDDAMGQAELISGLLRYGDQ